MAKDLKELVVFLSSPSDLEAERSAAVRVVDDVNKETSNTYGIRFRVWRWEEDAVTGAGETSQAVLDDQVLDHDVYIGMMWKKFGTSTVQSGSGTEHEFRKAWSGFKSGSNPREIGFFFKMSMDNLSGFNAREYIQVEEFRSELGELGVFYSTFLNLGDFERLLSLKLRKIARDWCDGVVKISNELPTECRDGLSDDSDELGYLDFLEIGEESSKRSNFLISKIGDALSAMSLGIAENTAKLEKINKSSSSANHNHVRTISNDVSVVLEEFESLASPMLEEALGHFEKGITAYSAAIGMERERDVPYSQDQVDTFKNILIDLVDSTNECDESMRFMGDAIAASPKLSLKYNRAKRKMLEFVENFHKANSRIRFLSYNLIGMASSMQTIEVVSDELDDSEKDKLS